MLIVNLMKYTKVFNDKILDYMLYYVNSNFDKMNIDDIIHILDTVSSNRKITPYELLYKLRNKIQNNQYHYSPIQTLKILNLFTRIKM